jgi:hypothetical protein
MIRLANWIVIQSNRLHGSFALVVVHMCDLDLWLSVGVMWGMSRSYTLINYFLIIKFIQNNLVFSYLYGFSSTNTLPLLSLSWVFFISSMLILQMANIKNHNNNNGENNGENN